MIHHKRDICLYIIVHGSAFRNNGPDEPVVVFAGTFLVRTVGITEKYFCALSPVNGTFHAFDIQKFMAVVGKDDWKTYGK